MNNEQKRWSMVRLTYAFLESKRQCTRTVFATFTYLFIYLYIYLLSNYNNLKVNAIAKLFQVAIPTYPLFKILRLNKEGLNYVAGVFSPWCYYLDYCWIR